MHKNSNRITCNFFTNDLQVSFVQNEIKYLAKYFHTVNVYYLIKSNYNAFPENVYLQHVNQNLCNSKEITRKYFLNIIKITISEIVFFPKYLLHTKLFRNEISRLVRSFYLFEILSKEFAAKSMCSVFYTFWFNDWATALSIAKQRNILTGYFSRAHGADLFENRVPVTKHIAFRNFQLKYISRVFSVSKKGEQYLKEKYPKYADKIFSNYLGTDDHGINPINEEKSIHIVSCATIRNIKRIHLIPDILKEINEPVVWYHFGGENSKDPTIPILKEKLKLLPENVKYVFKGPLSQSEVFEFYRTTAIDMFISVSETEGLPVSMMEAISFGIPILATDVGGCNEIIDQNSGILIPQNFEIKNALNGILNIKARYSNIDMRKKIREVWKNKFNLDKNFIQFLRETNVIL